VAVAGARLDRLLAVANLTHVNVLKIDVEGFELKVLQGAATLLAAERPPLVIFEFCDWAEARVPGVERGDAQRFLIAQGYSIRLADRYPRGRPMTAVMTDGAAMLVASRAPA
jgi:hypothetical protein